MPRCATFVIALLAQIASAAAANSTNCTDGLAASVFAAVDAENDGLRTVNREIWENPELAYHEYHAHEVLTDYLESLGFNVTRHAHGLNTSFRAEFSNGEGRSVSFNSEYDALPGIGHSCGHNLIATAGAAAAIGVKEALENGGVQGRVVLLGTPAEEAGGGKIDLLNYGAYDGLDCSIMAHPGNSNYGSYRPSMAAWMGNVTWEGYASHAAGSPWLGRNALDGFVSAYTNTGILRQQMRPEDRVHHVVARGPESLVNVIPDFINSMWGVRANHRPRRDTLLNQIRSILNASALATGTNVTVVDTIDYWEVNPSYPLAEAFYNNHMKYFDPSKDPRLSNFTNPSTDEEQRTVQRGGSSDQGNVSYKLPAIQVGFPVGGSFPVHNQGFREIAGTDFAHERALDAGKTMAMTALQVLRNETFAENMWRDWEAMMALVEAGNSV